MSKVKIAGSAPVSRQTRSAILVTAIAVSGVFSDGFPNRRVAADRGQRGVPRPDRDRKIESGDHGDNAERMPLLHQAMIRPLRLNRQAVKHARLTDGEIADVDHLLHFAFAFGDDLARLERDELTEIVLRFAQGVAELSNGFAANRAGRGRAISKMLRARERSPCRNPPPKRCERWPVSCRRSAKSCRSSRRRRAIRRKIRRHFLRRDRAC